MQLDRQDFRLNGDRWPDHTVTWSFADLYIPSDPRESHLGDTFALDDRDGMRSLIRDAFAAWENVCGIDFVEVADSISSDIRIGWTSPARGDGPYGTLAYYSWTWSGSTTLSGVIVVDWDDSGRPLSELYDTVLHEVGHAVGLDHSNVANVVMSGGLGTEPGGLTPYWSGVPGRDPLQPDDIAGARHLWGGPGSGGGTEPPPASGGTPTSGNDTLFGTQGPDRIDGGGGNDKIYGLRGNDTLLGGSGNDTLIGGLNLAEDGAHESTGGRNVLDGGPGNDHMTAGYAGRSGSTWSPAPGSDTFVFRPGHGHDVVYGAWGSTLGREFYGASEKIDLSGFGSRAPTWSEVSARLSVVNAASDTGRYAESVRLDLSDFGGGSITFWNIDRDDLDASDFIGLRTEPPPPAPPPSSPSFIPAPAPNASPAATERGTSGADTLQGGTGNDNVYGEGGNDALLGGDGNDYIYGGAGNDRIWGQGGNDALDGGAGSDLIYGLAGNDTIAGGADRDIVLAGDGDDAIRGDAGDDGVWAEGGADTVDGGAGDDFLAGGAGNDSLHGGAGADYLAGEGGDDTLDGGASRDLALAGGAGADRLIGGAEGETFFGQGGADTFVIRGGVSWVMDFDESDRLDIGMTLPQVQAAATQLGAHLHIDLAGGGDLYLANTTIAALDADNLI